ncbi:MAG: Asp23/Gls24 family envelope stress response protein [Candidatus Brocadiia bacterium]
MASVGHPPEPPVLRQELGTLEVSDRVFQDLVRRTVNEMPGVSRLGRPPTGLFGRRASEPVRVEKAHGEVAFTLNLSVRYEARIPDMVAELSRKVVETVEETTGYRVRSVNVTIDHILPPGDEADEQEESPQPPASQIPEPPPIPDQE